MSALIDVHAQYVKQDEEIEMPTKSTYDYERSYIIHLTLNINVKWLRNLYLIHVQPCGNPL
jgi:hypothetical protein